MVPTSKAEYMRARRAQKALEEGREPGRRGRPPTAKHGTVSGYKRHLRNNEEPCQPCRDANSAFHAERYRARKAKN